MTDFDPSIAIVPREKITSYLLSTTHAIGRYKSAFFTSLGYSSAAPEVLERDLIGLLRYNVAPLDVTPFGRKFVSRGTLTGPNGRQGVVVAIWIILSAQSEPRFVTAYPEG